MSQPGDHLSGDQTNGHDLAREEAERILLELASGVAPADAALSQFVRAWSTPFQQADQARLELPPPANSAPAAPAADQPETRVAFLEARYRTLIEQIPVVTFMASLNDDIQELYVSPQIEQLLGFTQREWLDNPFLWYNQLHPEDRARWRDEFGATCAAGVDFRSEYRFVAKDGHVVWVHGECKVVRDELGSPLFLQGIAFNITEIKRAQEALHTLNLELERRVEQRTGELTAVNQVLQAEIEERKQLEVQLHEASRRKDEFLALLGHELRNPLSPIRHGLYILKEQIEDSQIKESVVPMMERQVGNMERLVEDLLDVSRITRGKVQLKKQVIELAGLIEHAVLSVRPLLEARRHQIKVCVTPGLRVQADPTRLEQILTNLLNNAAKYTENGGQIALAAAQESDEIVINVQDNGIGISADLLPRVFDLFAQADRSLDRSEGGLGIGLTLVRELVEMHGGTVVASSQGTGLGSEFVVRLPGLAATHGHPVATPSVQSPMTAAKRRILVVDDNDDALKTLKMLLQMKGHEVATANSGPQALEIASTYRPQLALVDIGLPEMDGYELARTLRARPEGHRLLLVAVTGYGQQDDKRKAKEAGFDEHIVKPIDFAALDKLLAVIAE